MSVYQMNITGTKWRILCSAVEQFYEKGIYEAAVRDIARQAGLQPGTVYNYFLSKDDIVELMYEYYDYTILMAKPDLDAVLSRIETITPREILDAFLSNIQNESQGMFKKITAILIANVRLDERAEQRITRYLINHSKHYAETVAKELIKVGRLELESVEDFGEAFANVTFSALVRMHTSNKVTLDMWYGVCGMLLSRIK